jgi:hypothetical protein
MAAMSSIASSPKSKAETSWHVKPSTRRLASSQPRSARAIRALLYTTPTAMTAANTVTMVVKNSTFLADRSRKLCRAAALMETAATFGMALSCA